MKITPELREAAEKHFEQKECTCDPNSFYYGDICPYRDPAHDFIRGAEYQDPIAYERGRKEERERILGLLREPAAIEYHNNGEGWADWLESKLDQTPVEQSGGEGK